MYGRRRLYRVSLVGRVEARVETAAGKTRAWRLLSVMYILAPNRMYNSCTLVAMR